jgi:hypothetical protein
VTRAAGWLAAAGLVFGAVVFAEAQRPARGPAPPAPAPAPGAAVGVIRLRPLVVRDAQLNNVEALRLLVPTDWRAQGGIVWRHDRSILATAVLKFTGPGGEELNFLPIEPFAQSNPGYGFGVGANYLGNELQPAMDPRTFVTRIVMPRYRREVGAARLIRSEDVPGIPAPAPEAGITSQVRAGRFRFAYTVNGRPMEEDVYCVLQYNAAPAVQSIYWNALQLHSMRAEQGRLDGQTRLMQAMVSSARVNLQWYNGYRQVWQMWQQNVMQSIRNAGALSRYIAGINHEITTMNRQAWEQQQAAQDRMSRRFAEYVRGVDTYRNPVTSQNVALPGGYGRAWTNRLGEYIVSDNQSFNPNIGSTVEWQPMPRVP